MGYSRFILGVHSVNQILFGMSLGLLTVALVLNVIRPQLISHFDKIKSRQYTLDYIKKCVVGVWLLSTSLVVIVLIVYLNVFRDGEIPIADEHMKVIKMCKPNLDDAYIKLENLLFAGTPMTIAGVYSGLVFKNYYLQPNEHTNLNMGLRLLTFLLVSAPATYFGYLSFNNRE
jgi:hypothetical protein